MKEVNTYKQDNMTIHNADCMEIMSQYEDNYFDLAVVDPPYGIKCAKTINIKNKKKGFVGDRLHKSKSWDDGIPPEEYFIELQRVSKDQIIWGGNYFTEHLKPVKAWIFWSKKETKTQGSNFSDGELAWTSLKKVTKLFEYGWIGIDYCNKGESKIHPTQKPVKLYNWIYANYAEEGQKILDTHLGSGSNAIAAHYAKMHFVGCELDEDYYKASVERIRKETRQLELF